MGTFTLLFQVASIALVAPSWGLPQNVFKPHKSLLRPQGSPFADSDYFVAPITTEKPLRIIAAEQTPSETREEFLVRKRLQEEELRRQAESAKYSFASSLSDRIMDGEHIRTETRDGLKTTGSYTYSDGFVRRTVEYIADENGYRVIKQTEEQIGDGPQPDPTGGADVSAYYDRSKLEYSITADDIRGYHVEEEEEEDEEETTKYPYKTAFNRKLGLALHQRPVAAQPTTATPVPVPVQVPLTVPAPTPKVILSHNFNTEQVPLRPTERHDIQNPLRPNPVLRGQYFTQVHSL